MYPPLFFAETGASGILERGLTLSNNIADAWNLEWISVFQSPLYASINHLAATFAVGSLLFFMIRFFRNMVMDELGEQLIDLLWPIMVVILLANNAHLTASTTLAMRGMIHKASDDILHVELLGVKLEDAIQNSVLRAAVGGEISAQLNQCQGLVDQPQIDCLEKANAQVQESIKEFQAKTGIPGSFVKIGAEIESALRQNPLVNGTIGAGQTAGGQLPGAIGAAKSGNILGAAGQITSAGSYGAAGFFGGYFNAVVQSLVQTLLLAFQWAFANILEISMLLTALMGPIAVAGSLLPFGTKSIFAWLIGFFSLGMAQISYNIIVGLCAEVIVKSDITDVNGFLVIVGLLAPALALAIAAGGGMSVFNIISSSSASAVALLVTKGVPWSKEI